MKYIENKDHVVNRRNALKQLGLLTAGAMALNLEAKKKKGKGKGKGKGKEDNKPKVEEKKMTGTIAMENKGITTSYIFLADKSYIISKSLEGKVKDYDGQQVTIYGSFYLSKVVNKVIKIGGITSK